MEIHDTIAERYLILEKLGAGGMANVMRARDLILGREVAVKILHESLATSDEIADSFLSEAKSVAALRHPNIVTVHDVGSDGGLNYMVLEYVPGQTLKEFLEEHALESGGLDEETALRIAIQICEGVAEAHRSGIVHCDIKPHNILVDQLWRVKVADFGIARIAAEGGGDGAVEWATPQYFSPEQAAGESPVLPSDVYSIGVVLFELLAGQLPFEAGSQRAFALKHMHEIPPDAHRVNRNIGRGLSSIIAKAMAKEPSGRYRSAAQLGLALQRYAKQRYGPIYGNTLMDSVDGSKMAAQGYSQPTVQYQSEGVKATSDLLGIAFAVLALLAMGGLIPLYYSVFKAWVG